MITYIDLEQARAAYCSEMGVGPHARLTIMAGYNDTSPWIKGYARCRADWRIALAAAEASRKPLCNYPDCHNWTNLDAHGRCQFHPPTPEPERFI